MAPPPKFEVKRIPSVPHPGPPPIPPNEIVQKFAANEDIARKVYDSYDFSQSVSIEELMKGGGRFSVSGEMYTKPDGKRYWRVGQNPESTLKFTSFSLEDVRTILDQPLFFLTPEEIGHYNFLYAGQYKLDQLNTYVFQVKPKLLSTKRVLFQGVVYVDDQDLAIVESYGKFVSEIPGSGQQLPFKMFDTYRENLQSKYWLPTYTSSEDIISIKDVGQVHLRLIIRATDFKLPSSPAAGTSGAAGSRLAPLAD